MEARHTTFDINRNDDAFFFLRHRLVGLGRECRGREWLDGTPLRRHWEPGRARGGGRTPEAGGQHRGSRSLGPDPIDLCRPLQPHPEHPGAPGPGRQRERRELRRLDCAGHRRERT